MSELQHARIEMLARSLKLERMAVDWSAIAQDVARNDGSHGDFLERLLSAENDARAERQRTTLMKLASLPAVKTLEQFDFSFASGVPRAQVTELTSLAFIELKKARLDPDAPGSARSRSTSAASASWPTRCPNCSPRPRRRPSGL